MAKIKGEEGGKEENSQQREKKTELNKGGSKRD